MSHKLDYDFRALKLCFINIFDIFFLLYSVLSSNGFLFCLIKLSYIVGHISPDMS